MLTSALPQEQGRQAVNLRLRRNQSRRLCRLNHVLVEPLRCPTRRVLRFVIVEWRFGAGKVIESVCRHYGCLLEGLLYSYIGVGSPSFKWGYYASGFSNSSYKYDREGSCTKDGGEIWAAVV